MHATHARLLKDFERVCSMFRQEIVYVRTTIAARVFEGRGAQHGRRRRGDNAGAGAEPNADARGSAGAGSRGPRASSLREPLERSANEIGAATLGTLAGDFRATETHAP